MTLCNPAMLYLILSIITILMGISAQVQVSVYIVKLIWMVVWVYILNLLCSKGYTTVSWVLVLLPFILIAFMALMMLEVTMRLAHRAPEQRQ
jgi:hypothetical protein